MQLQFQSFEPDAVAAVAAAIAAAISAVTVYFSLKQTGQAEKERRAAICLEISRRYDEAYGDLIELEASPLQWDEFHNKYPNRFQKLASAEWRQLRRAGGFFELVGSFVVEGLVDKDLIFKFMNIRPRVWLQHRSVIDQMRKDNRELWIHWEKLVEKYYEERPEQKEADLKAVKAQAEVLSLAAGRGEPAAPSAPQTRGPARSQT